MSWFKDRYEETADTLEGLIKKADRKRPSPLDWAQDNYPEAIRVFRCDAGGGRGASLEPNRSSEGHSDPTAAIALGKNPASRVAYDIEELHTAVTDLDRALRRLEKLMRTRVLAIRAYDGEFKSTICANPDCLTHVENTTDNQLLKGFCRSCYDKSRNGEKLPTVFQMNRLSANAPQPLRDKGSTK